MKHRMRAFLALGAFAFAPAALADDSSAMLGAGGIVLTKNADIRMASEDLFMSPTAIRVHYTFANDGAKDVDTIVAFPLPDVDNAELAESPIGTTVGGGPNFVGFKLTVDGKTVTPTAEEHALFQGRDVSAAVRAAGLPLNIVIGGYDKLQKLPRPAAAALVKAGLLENEGDDKAPNYHALWTTTTKFWWPMHFPAGRTVSVDHSYQPVTGQTFFTTTALGDAQEAADYNKNYCIDGGTRAAIAAGFAALKKRSGSDGMFNQYTTDFVIVTANNWKGPIGRFHLTVDKLKPDNIVSLCWGGTLTKTGATRFESTLQNFAPRADIKLLVLEQPAPQ
ncbi:MAG TPA: DUF4424 family protein [Rhizomicrobium sp.]|jgi:hypothetical protein|nr:DUF4424 family protein [Rhizomicrobium sp.]